MKFAVGDKVVYPGQGAATIRRISKRDTPSGKVTFYVLRLLARDAVVLVPTAGAERVGLRAASSAKELEELFSFLHTDPDRAYLQDWRAQERDYWDKIREGSLLEIARILKALYLRSQERSLSFKRRKMLDHTWDVVVSEIAVVKGISHRRASALLEQTLNQSQER